MQHGLRFGAKNAVVAGRLAAFVVMLALAVAGLVVVPARSQTVFEAVKWAEVAYLAYLGIRSIAARPVADDQAGSALRTVGRVALARREFLTVAANPKRCCCSPRSCRSSSTPLGRPPGDRSR